MPHGSPWRNWHCSDRLLQCSCMKWAELGFLCKTWCRPAIDWFGQHYHTIELTFTTSWIMWLRQPFQKKSERNVIIVVMLLAVSVHRPATFRRWWETKEQELVTLRRIPQDSNTSSTKLAINSPVWRCSKGLQPRTNFTLLQLEI